MGVETAIIGGALIGAGGSVLASKSAKKAANTQAGAQKYAADLQYQMYLQNRQDMAPWRTYGAESLLTLNNMLNRGPGDFYTSPGYDWRLKQGLDAIKKSAVAQGSLGSGKTLKAITEYGQNYASNEYQNFLNNYYKSLDPYFSLAGLGQTTAGQLANAGTMSAANQGNFLAQAGTTQAAGQLGQMAPYQNLLNWGASNLMNYGLMNAMNNPASSLTSTPSNWLLPRGGGSLVNYG